MNKKLRSHKWFYGTNETGLLHKGALRAIGIDMDNYHGEPVIGIANTWGEVNNCNMSLKIIAEEVRSISPIQVLVVNEGIFMNTSFS